MPNKDTALYIWYIVLEPKGTGFTNQSAGVSTGVPVGTIFPVGTYHIPQFTGNPVIPSSR